MKKRINPFLGALVVISMTQTAHSADASWSLGTGGGNWSQDSAWTPAAAPGATSGTTNIDTATFDSSTRTVTSTIAVDADRNIGNITFNSTNAFGYSLGSGSLILSTGGTILSTGSGTGSNVINTGLTLQGNSTFTANANLQFNTANATITTAGSLGGVTLNVGGTWTGGTVLSSGIISEGSGSTLSIVKAGPSTWQFNGNNTYTGGITIKEGSAGYGLNGGFGLGTVTLGDSSGSASAAASFGSSTTMSNAITVQAGSSGTLSLLRGGGTGPSTVSGPITLANNLTISQNASNTQNFTISSAISGTGNVSVKSLLGTGTTTLSNASINFTGSLSNDGVSASPTLISGAIGANVTGVTQNSTTSILTLSGANTYTTATTVNVGTLKLGSATAIPTASALTVASGAFFDVNGINGSIGTFSGSGTITNNSTGTGTATLAATGGTWTGSITDGPTAKVALTMYKATAIILGGINTFTGGLTIGNATNTPFSVTSETALGNGPITVANNSSFRLTNGQIITGKTVSIQGTGGGPSGGNGNGALNLISGTATWAGDIRSGSGASTSGRIGANTGTLTITGNISNNAGTSAAGLDIVFNSDAALGSGIIILSGTANTYTGSTIVGRGVLKIGANDVLPSTSILQVGTGGTVGGRFDLNGFNQTVGGLQRTASNALESSILNNGTADSTLTISTALATTASFNGVIKDGTKKVSIVKSGTGSQALIKPNSYTGNTTVSDGTLILGDGTANTALADLSEVIVGTTGLLNLNFLAANSDTVNKLTIGGVQKAAGVWGSTASGAANVDDTHFSGTGTLNVITGPAASGYATWIDTPAFGLTAGQKGVTADPDNDGIANLVEFVLNGNPGASDPSIMPQLVVTATDFEFTFNRRDDSLSPGTSQVSNTVPTLSVGRTWSCQPPAQRWVLPPSSSAMERLLIP